MGSTLITGHDDNATELFTRRRLGRLTTENGNNDVEDAFCVFDRRTIPSIIHPCGPFDFGGNVFGCHSPSFMNYSPHTHTSVDYSLSFGEFAMIYSVEDQVS